MGKKRLDLLLVEKGIINSRSMAQRMVMAGDVRVNGQVVFKPSILIVDDAKLTLDRGPRFVSRGGEKLEAALIHFDLTELKEKVCVDVGASTGGFTECLLKYGAKYVYALDVGYGILHWKLRNDNRVKVLERTNARYVDGFPEIIDLVTIDASFISIKVLLPVVKKWFRKNKDFEAGCGVNLQQTPMTIALIKPQFEAGKADAAKGKGVIRDSEIHRQVLLDILDYAADCGFIISGLIRSPLKGAKGNVEFLAHFVLDDNVLSRDGYVQLVESVLV